MTSAAWQRELSRAITSPEDLVQALDLDPALLEGARAASKAFGLRVTPSFLSRMRRGDARDPLLRQVLPLGEELTRAPGYVSDPLLRQVLPLGEELTRAPGYVSDPLHERGATRAPNLLQKYAGRALLITTQACAIHCRYCFRREFPYQEQRDEAVGGRWAAAIEAIAQDPSLEEVILSGGDPLSLSDVRLETLTRALARISHVRRLRVHTRQPVVLPSRVDDGLLNWISGIGRPTVFVLHVNHPNEIDEAVRGACARLRAAGVTLLNQSVLLDGVNDDVDTLARLSGALFDAGVTPYYLHLPDRVGGTAHFEVAEARARRLVAELAARLSGYLVPRLVREIPGAPGKTLI